MNLYRHFWEVGKHGIIKSKIWDSINRFLEFKRLSSENTYKNYASHINEFFKEMRGKNYTQLSINDLHFERKDLKQYQLNLYNKGYKSTTISIRIGIIKKMYQSLAEDGFDLDLSIFNFDRITIHDSTKYGSLSPEEIREIIKFVSKMRSKSQEKVLLIELAFSTGFRLKSLLNLKKSNFKMYQGLFIVDTIGKGNKKDVKQLPERLWTQAHNLVSGDKVFTITEKTVSRMMNSIRNEFDFGDRHIVFHSFKKASINYVGYKTNNNIKAMQRQGNHSNASTTLNNYIDDMKLENTVLIDLNDDLDLSIIKSSTHQELIDAVLQLDEKTKLHLISMLNK